MNMTIKMNKEIFEQAFIHRLLIEQNYSLLIDADEQTIMLPDQEEWKYKLEHSEPDSLEQNVLDYLEACQSYHDSLPTVGGSLDRAVTQGESDDIWKPNRVTLPELLPLKHYGSRILVKATPVNTQIILFSEPSHSLPSREWLVQLCNNVRREVLANYEIEKSSLHTIAVTTIVIGASSNEQFQLVKKLSNKFARDKNFFRYVCVDPENKQVRTPTTFHTMRERHIIKAVFSSNEHSVESLYANYQAKVFSWWRVILSGSIAFFLTHAFLLVFIGSDILGLSTLSQIFVPMIVFAIAFSTMKNRQKVYQQVMYGVLIHVTLTAGLYILFRSPSNLLEWIPLAQMLFITGAPSLLVGRVLEATN